MPNTKQVALLAVMTAVAVLAGWVEFTLSYSVGLANAAVLIVLFRFDAKTALVVNVVRVLVVGLLFGGVWRMMFSLCGALFSFAVMIALKRTGRFSVVGLSAAGGAAHNAAQLLVAAWSASAPHMWTLLPWLLLTGTLSGILTGTVAYAVIKRTTDV